MAVNAACAFGYSLRASAVSLSIDAASRRRSRRGAGGKQPAGVGERGGFEIALDDRVEETHRERRGRVDRLGADDQVQGLLDTDQPRQALRAAGTRNDAQGHLRQPEPGPRCGHAVVAGHGELETAAEHGAVHGRDHRKLEGLDAREQRPKLGLLRRPAELADVGAGTKRAAVTAQQHGAHAGERRQPVERREQSPAQIGRDRVDGWVVDRQNGDIPVLLHTHDLLFAHAASLVSI